MAITQAELDYILSITGKKGILPSAAATTPNPIAETMPRPTVATVTTVGALTTGTLYMFGLSIPAGALITAITFISGTTAEATGTHLWFALFDQNRVFLGQSADDTGATSLAASTLMTKALQAPYTTTYAGLYYVGFMCTAGTTPTLIGQAQNTALTGIVPVLAGASTTGLLTNAPQTAAALTAFAGMAYAFVS